MLFGIRDLLRQEYTEVEGPALPTADGTGDPAPAHEPAILPADSPPPGDGPPAEEVFEVGADPNPQTEPADDGEPAETRQSRRSRRAQRYDEMQRNAAAAEKARMDAEARAARLEGMLQAYQQGAQSAPQPQQAQSDPEAEHKQRLGAIAQQMDTLNQASNARAGTEGKLTPEEHAEYRSQFAELQRQYHTEIASHVRAQEQRNQPAQTGTSRGEALRVHIEAQFPDVAHNPQAGRFANGEYQKLVALGHPESFQTVQQAWMAARQHFAGGNGATPGYQPPSHHPTPPTGYMPPGANTRMTGAPPSSASSATASPVAVSMTADMKKMADMVYSYEPNSKIRYQRYVNEVVKPNMQRLHPPKR